MAAVRMTVDWCIPLGQARSLTIALHSLMAEARAAHGCVSCSVSTDIRDRGTVHYVEEWQTEDDLRLRLRCSTFTELAALIEGAAEPPVVSFSLPGGTRGLDFVEEVLHASH